MSELPPIPGIHRRNCRSCGAAVTLTAEESSLVRKGRTTQTREASCPGCRAPVRYTVRLNGDASTQEDTSEANEFALRIKRLVGIGT